MGADSWRRFLRIAQLFQIEAPTARPGARRTPTEWWEEKPKESRVTEVPRPRPRSTWKTLSILSIQHEKSLLEDLSGWKTVSPQASSAEEKSRSRSSSRWSPNLPTLRSPEPALKELYPATVENHVAGTRREHEKAGSNPMKMDCKLNDGKTWNREGHQVKSCSTL